MPVTREEDNPQLVRYFITDVLGNELEEYETGDKIVLQIETENRIGDMLYMNLNDKTHDFEYNGVVLVNDTIENYIIIINNHEQIELEVIDQIN